MRFLNIFCLVNIIFVGCLGISGAFAVPAELKEIENIKDLERKAGEKPEEISRPKVTYDAQDLRDPFVRTIIKDTSKRDLTMSKAATKQPPVLNVQGIIWGGRIPQAIINNKVVTIGDKIEEARVIGINKEGVIVFFEDSQYTLPSPVSKDKSDKKHEGGQDEKNLKD